MMCGVRARQLNLPETNPETKQQGSEAKRGTSKAAIVMSGKMAIFAVCIWYIFIWADFCIFVTSFRPASRPSHHATTKLCAPGMARELAWRRQAQSKDGGLDDLKIDESKLSAEERERLAFIQKLTLEADEMVRVAGFSIDGQQNQEEIARAVQDTKWSGQSDVEATITSTSNYQDLQNRPALAVTDALAIITFACIGRSNHGEALDVVALLGTAAPFLISWFAVSPFTGAFSRAATSSKTGVPKGIFLGWAVAIPLAIALRGVLKGAIPPAPFIMISLVSTMILLSIYRFAFLFLVGETSDSETRSAGGLEVFKMVGSLIKRW